MKIEPRKPNPDKLSITVSPQTPGSKIAHGKNVCTHEGAPYFVGGTFQDTFRAPVEVFDADLIDDDPELRGALTEQLSLYEEYETVAAENGNKGVQAAKAGQIDLVIMDVGLPDIDGREAVRSCSRASPLLSASTGTATLVQPSVQIRYPRLLCAGR